MKHTIEIAGREFTVDYDYRVTSKAVPPRGPSYASGGEPAEPMEYEVTVNSMRRVWPMTQQGRPVDHPDLDLPEWLKILLVKELQESDDVYSAIEQDEADAEYSARADQYDSKRDDAMEDGR